jgi:hypothetical protein
MHSLLTVLSEGQRSNIDLSPRAHQRRLLVARARAPVPNFFRADGIVAFAGSGN